jgi:GxxExxY protein
LTIAENVVGDAVVDAALRVHTALGPGLLESACEACLAHELLMRGLQVRTQIQLPVVYRELRLDVAYRADMLVGERVVIEVKAVERMLPVHVAQVLRYLKLCGYKLGYLLNFNVAHMRSGIKRVVNGL